MGRSKERGKPVHELTPEELEREARRCRTLIGVYGNRIAAKELRKRLLAIERRLRRDD
ncbi:MAG: hypothetical protein M9894_19880 [Planctomycetes bacterium]|nr:hypothetical protein [Planctomycetota bacterium]